MVKGFVEQQCFGGAANAGAAHLGVDHHFLGHGWVRCFVNIDVADAFKVTENRDAGFVLNPGNQTFAAAWNDDVDGATQTFEHFTNGGAVCGGDQFYGGFGQVGGFEAGF